MITFLRKIRQRLLVENKFTKYLFYAIGEIFLIVIGILFALQISNWNENKKGIKKEITFLKSLKDDIDFDISTLEERIKINETRIANTYSIFKILQTKNELSKKETLEFIDLHVILRTESYFIPEKGTINQIESGSHGNLIKNENLRKQIFRYYSMNNRIENNNEKRLQLYQNSEITKHIMKKIFLSGDFGEQMFGSTFNHPRINIPNLKMDMEYFNAIAMKLGYTEHQNSIYIDIRTDAEKLIEFINEELLKITKS